MIVQEIITLEDGRQFLHTYSDTKHKLLQVDTGAIYDETVDIVDTPHIYEESDEMIEESEPDDEYAEAGRILLGERD